MSYDENCYEFRQAKSVKDSDLAIIAMLLYEILKAIKEQ